MIKKLFDKIYKWILATFFKKKIDQICTNLIIEQIKAGKLESQSEDFWNNNNISKWPQFYNAFKKTGECHFSGCNKQTIKCSHSITKRNCLKLISDQKNHVIYPRYDYFKKKVAFEKIGINEASVFPGFCREHENSFKDFESGESINESSLILFQSYRAVCREIFYYQNLIETSTNILVDYQKYLNSEALSRYKIEVNKFGIKELNKNRKFEVTGSRIQQITKSNIYHQSYISRLQKLKKSMDETITDAKHKKGVQYKGEKYKINIPLALSGCAQVPLNKDEYFLLNFNVIPRNGEMYVFLTSYNSNQDFFNAIVNEYFGDYFQILNLIESLMIYGTDNWYISPSYWNNIPDEIKDKILDTTFLSPNFNFQKLPFTIFNDVRAELPMLANSKKEK